MSTPIVVSQHVAAPPPVVYSYLTDSEKWARWQGEEATIEATTGGIFRIAMPNGSTARGEFVELVPNRRVVFTWGWIDHPGVPPGSSTVTIDIADDGDGSLITLTHSDLPPEEIDLHRRGWDHYLPRLAGIAAGEVIGIDSGPGQSA